MARFVMKCDACGCDSEVGVAGPECAHLDAWKERAAQALIPVLAEILVRDIRSGKFDVEAENAKVTEDSE